MSFTRLTIFYFVFFISSTSNVVGQSMSYDLWYGLSMYQGDIKSESLPSFKSSAAVGFGITYSFDQKLSLVANFKKSKISADDKGSSDPLRRERNLNFTSHISELSLSLRRTLFVNQSRIINPYIDLGLALFHFNPYTFDRTGIKHFLKPLGTEGQGTNSYSDRKSYSLIQFSIPLEIGIYIKINNLICITYNFGWRKTFTDYLDDISKTYADPNALIKKGPKTLELAFRGNEINPSLPYPSTSFPRGNSKNMDGYFFSGLGMAFQLPKNRQGYKKENSQMNCPSF
ncbi:MAG: DUF6089 family protein [Chitinophagaceae bacterium]